MQKLPQFIDDVQVEPERDLSREKRRCNISIAKTFLYKKKITEEELRFAIGSIHEDSFRARGVRLALIERFHKLFPGSKNPPKLKAWNLRDDI